MKRIRAILTVAIFAFLFALPVYAGDSAEGNLGKELPIWSVSPFVLMLLSIAVLPLFASHWWEKNRNKAIISFLLSLPVGVYLLMAAPHELAEKMIEYAAFISLLGSLFIISGGIYLKGSLAGTPLVNTLFLAIGAAMASVVGTTGASMLLIRPLLRANQRRRDKAHIVIFFIFIVSNIGGCLTPLGDPPLYLGFLQGVPFTWTFRLAAQWAFANVILLIIFNLLDQYKFNREDVATPGALTEDVQSKEPLRIEGKINFLFLLGVVASAFFSGYLGSMYAWSSETQVILQVIGMAAMALFSLLFTGKETRKGNSFTFNPIIEVAVLFIGIFVTMIPALLILKARGQEIGVTEPWHFFWASGALSSFLDNAPTYLVFLELGRSVAPTTDLQGMIAGVTAPLLAAISLGSVFMGANTYIGNGPNFMVKSVAEESGVKMPSFFGYMLYSIAILIPLFILITFVFFR